MARQLGLCVAAIAAFLAGGLVARPAAATTGGITLTNGDFELPGPVNNKTVAFDSTGTTGAIIPGIIPGWMFTGGSGVAATGETNANVGNALTSATDTMPGDSGTEGGGHPGNELLLSTFDGKVFQTSGTNIVSLAATPNQDYRLSFDAHDIFTVFGANFANTQYSSAQTNPSQLTARLYYGAARTTLLSQVFPVTGTNTNYVMKIGGTGDPPLPPAAIGQPIGVEFDTTSYENSVALNASTSGANPITANSWVGVDNVVLQIAGLLPGDLNGDGLVNINDYRVIRDHLQTNASFFANGDLNGDNKVDLNDFRAFTKITGPLPGSGAGATAGSAVPEPSTLLLSLFGLAMFSSVRFVRIRVCARRLQSFVVAAIAMSAIVLSSSRSQAVQLAYDPFNDTNGDYTDGPIAGQNPTIGPASPSFFRNAWNLQGNATGLSVLPTSLSYLGKPGVGGSLGGSVGGAANGRNERFLNDTGNPAQAKWDSTMNGTFYMGFQVNFGTVGADNAMAYHAVEFFPTGVSPGENRIGDIGYNQFFSSFGPTQQAPATAKMQFNFPGGQQIIDGAPASYNQDGVTHLIVLKFVLSSTAASDAISLYLDPTNGTEPEIANAAVSGVDFTLGAVGPAQFAGAGNPTVFDELRVGTTFSDVVPSFPVPGDTDGDGDVDLVDYQHIHDHMGLRGQSTLNGDVAKGDGTQGVDGIVDINDFRLWKSHFPFPGAGSGASSSGSVPEPSTLILALLGALGCLVRVARK